MKSFSKLRENPKRLGLVKKVAGYGSLVAISAALIFAPSPFLVEHPGPVYNVLSTINGQPVISIKDATTYPTEGELDLLTVSIKGDPVRGASWVSIIESFFSEGYELIPIAEYYPPGVDFDEIDQQADIMMLDSQATAKGAALRELGYEIKSSVKVSVVQSTGAAAGILRAGDTLLTVDGEIATGIDQVRAQVAASKGKRPVVLEVLRKDTEKVFEITPRFVDGSWRLGIFVASVPEIPLDIDIDAGNVSGPSGGQIFALAIYDLMTPGSLTGGKQIAGTGTIEVDGSIGPIGGVKQKLVGAKNAGAKYFLLPESNCSDAKGNIPAGMKVIAVSNLKESLKAIEAIKSGSTGALPGCN